MLIQIHRITAYPPSYSAGVRPCGQLEWRWAASLAQAPCFPYDFPHTASGTSWLQSERQRHWASASRRPPGRARKVSSAAAYVPWSTVLGKHIIAVADPAAGSIRSAAGSTGSTGGTPTAGPRERGVGRLRLMARCPEDTGLLLPRPKGGSLERGLPDEITLAPSCPYPVCWNPTAQSGPPQRASSSPTGALSGSLTRVERKCRQLLARALRAGSGGVVGRAPTAELQDHTRRPNGESTLLTPLPSIGAPVAAADPRGVRLVYAVLRVIGKGRCEEGAAVMTEDLRATPSVASVNGPGRDPASIGEEGSVPMIVIGFVTSGFPRGLPGGAYPGGMSLCDTSHLNHRDGDGVTGMGGSGRPIKGWICNPGSMSLRRVSIKML